MQKNLLVILITVAILLGLRWYLAPKDPDPATIAVIDAAIPAKQATGDSVVLGDENQVVVPDTVLATIDDVGLSTLPSTVGSSSYTLAPMSKVQRVGKKVGGQHYGSVAISSGAAYVKDGKLLAGFIVLDMRTIQSLDGAGESLDTHLQSDEFFDVKRYEKAVFVLTSVQGGQITGRLTIKDITKTIRFPGIVIVEDDAVMVQAAFSFDRKQRGVNGGGPVVSEFIGLSFALRFGK